MNWEAEAEQKFIQLIEKVPVFMRPIARDKVSQRAERIAKDNNREQITEKDMVDAFFAETPFGFHGPMKTDMETVGVDYRKYGHQ